MHVILLPRELPLLTECTNLFIQSDGTKRVIVHKFFLDASTGSYDVTARKMVGGHAIHACSRASALYRGHHAIGHNVLDGFRAIGVVELRGVHGGNFS